MIPFICCENQKLTCKYGLRTHPVTHEHNSFHIGVDIVGDSKIVSPLEGGIIVGMGYDKLSGNWVKVQYPDDLIVSFCHLKTSSSAKLMGYDLKKNEWFCTMGDTGRSTGVHCHLTFRKNGEIVDPTTLDFTF